MYRLFSYLLSSILIILMMGCSNSQEKIANHNDNQEGTKSHKPSWVFTAGVGVSRITSKGISMQRSIALRRAIAELLVTKGVARGTSEVNGETLSITNENKEKASEKTTEKYNVVFSFKNIKYNVRITNIWEDSKTSELYLKIEEI